VEELDAVPVHPVNDNPAYMNADVSKKFLRVIIFFSGYFQ